MDGQELKKDLELQITHIKKERMKRNALLLEIITNFYNDEILNENVINSICHLRFSLENSIAVLMQDKIDIPNYSEELNDFYKKIKLKNNK